MRISKKGLYALEALMMLARGYPKRAAKIREIASSEQIPEKFLELILLDLKRARLVESSRGANGGYALKRDPSKILLGEVIRTIDGPLAPMGDAETLRRLVKLDKKHSPLYQIFLDVRKRPVPRGCWSACFQWEGLSNPGPERSRVDASQPSSGATAPFKPGNLHAATAMPIWFDSISEKERARSFSEAY